MTTAAQALAQAREWLGQRLVGLGGGAVLAGVDIGQMAVNGKVGYGLRVHVKPEGMAWCKQCGFPGLLETPHGRFYVAVLPVGQTVEQPAGQPVGQPGTPDPYKGWEVKVSGTETAGASIKYSGTDPAVIRGPAKVSGTDTPEPRRGEFRPKSGAFGSAFPGFGEGE